MALTDRSIHIPDPTFGLALGAANYGWTDPVFGSRMKRVTDDLFAADLDSAWTSNSFRSASAAYQQGWSADNSKFYVVMQNSLAFVVSFDPTTMNTARLGTGATYLPFNFGLCVWDSQDPDLLYGMSLSTPRSVEVVDVSSSISTGSILISLDSITPGLPNPSYLGALNEGNGNLMVVYGGASQEYNHYCLFYPLGNPSGKKVLDTLTRDNMDEADTKFTIHGAQIDKSGRYVLITPTGYALDGRPRALYWFYVWDTTTDQVYPFGPNNVTGGHKVCGWGNAMNTPNNGDAAQWTFTPNLSQSTVLSKHDIVSPLMLPRETYAADHSSWNNATSAANEPFTVGFYRAQDGQSDVPQNTCPFRAWDNEIFKVDPVTGAVTRFCHTNTDYIKDEALPTADIFWYTPRPNVSNNGNWAYFTSNMHKNLGIQPGVNIHRQDVFLVEMTDITPPAPPPSILDPRITFGRAGRRVFSR